VHDETLNKIIAKNDFPNNLLATVQLNYNFIHAWNSMQNIMRDLAWNHAL